MLKKDFENIINEVLKVRVDFVETFYQKGFARSLEFSDGKLSDIIDSPFEGIGIRTVFNEKESYAHTNDLSEKSLSKLIKNIKVNYNKRKEYINVKLKRQELKSHRPIVPHKEFSDLKKKELMSDLDKYARSLDERIVQVKINFYEKEYDVTIANSDGLLISENRNYTRIFLTVVAKENEKTGTSYTSVGVFGGYEVLKKKDLKGSMKDITDSAIKKLNPTSIKGGNMPVVIESGFGAVIFHEACGHAMEATSVSRGTSILTGKLGEKIASDKVTIIDDGKLKGYWGSTMIDDEGKKTRKNVLIKDGVLKNYLIHGLGSIKMNMKETGSSRRESYEYMPTSRMNNTYLAPGTDKKEDMIKSIKYGLYAKSMGGGSVDPITGDFNFATNEAYLIENGKIGPIVKSATLIGNTLDILKNVEAVSDNLEFDPGMCGSESGSVPVCIGEPTIKVSSILVGGDK